jgi:hypothetical protein
MTVSHYNVFTKAVPNQTSNSLFVCQRTAYIAVSLHFHTKRLEEDHNTSYDTA